MLRTSNPEAREQVLRYHHLLNVSRFETYCMKNTISYLPRTKTSLFLDENVRAREGGKETTGFACRLCPSHGPLRFITSRSPLADLIQRIHCLELLDPSMASARAYAKMAINSPALN